MDIPVTWFEIVTWFMLGASVLLLGYALWVVTTVLRARALRRRLDERQSTEDSATQSEETDA